MKTSYLKFNNLSVGYGHKAKAKIVAQNLSATIHSGELVCLLGANGTGKSTLLRTLCGFQSFFGGEVNLMEKDLRRMDEKEISLYLSVVLTERVIVPNATVRELVAYGRSPHTGILGRLDAEDHKLIEQSMEQCGILHKGNELLSNLSDGERQKAFIAKALAQNTPIIVLDEPTAFLDLPARVEVLQLLRKVASDSGKAILLSTHDLDLALQMADKLWLLKPGGPLVDGSPEDLLLNNAFQDMFQKQGIVFDARTGLFRVEYQYWMELPVKGHGFEYVLLRRAFARKGVKTIPYDNHQDIWIEINNLPAKRFHFYKNNTIETADNSTEKIVNDALDKIKNNGLNGHSSIKKGMSSNLNGYV